MVGHSTRECPKRAAPVQEIAEEKKAEIPCQEVCLEAVWVVGEVQAEKKCRKVEVKKLVVDEERQQTWAEKARKHVRPRRVSP